MLPKKLQTKLNKRIASQSLRKLSLNDEDKIDFYSNDYLGYAKDKTLYEQTHQTVLSLELKNGSTGSRLISGNSNFHEEVERQIAQFHQSETALLYNSGYVANIGFFSCVPQRGDFVFYDELIHASIRDALSMSFAKSVKFKHNNVDDLNRLLEKYQETNDAEFYVVTEGVFSMDGDSPKIEEMLDLCKKHNAKLIVDEAHSLGIFGKKGEGLVQHLGLQDDVFARIMTYGKALGGHGASILGSKELKQYLINFSRSFIYTTALSPHAVAHIKLGYQWLEEQRNIPSLNACIAYFNQKIKTFSKKEHFISSQSAIQSLLISGNENVIQVADYLQKNGFNIKPILSPTVPKGEERLRITLHSYNTNEEIDLLFHLFNQII